MALLYIETLRRDKGSIILSIDRFWLLCIGYRTRYRR
ncbi:hypothetical protein ZBT109_1844 [Zymobacter palmae]|uniref:Uncharacterized protein n=1 Tax=Zymobacter palmae TaxID=33074 RepID=A0A348HG38_9GAMM|nr:hypothetical protein ZBT109_1844 [Zymobacter palmae]